MEKPVRSLFGAYDVIIFSLLAKANKLKLISSKEWAYELFPCSNKPISQIKKLIQTPPKSKSTYFNAQDKDAYLQ